MKASTVKIQADKTPSSKVYQSVPKSFETLALRASKKEILLSQKTF
jgi:hypothetical protein